MRAWCGVDVEHNPGFGNMTLFIESENPNIDKILKILARCNYGISNYEISYVYFGAGEVDVKNWEFLDRLYEISNVFPVGLESSVPLSQDILDHFDFVIFRLPVPYISDKIYFKCRSDYVVGVSKITEFNMTSLAGLKSGQYLNDVEIYNDEE